MKKFIVLAMSLLLILSMSNIAFAKNYVQLELSYNGDFYKDNDDDGARNSTISVGLSGEMNIVSAFSLNANISVLIDTFTMLEDGNVDYKENVLSLDATLIGKYFVVNSGLFDLALGAEINYINETLNIPDSSLNTLNLGLGIYASVNIASKLNLYGSVSLPMANLSWGQYDSNNKYMRGAFSFGSPTLVLGVKYSIFANFFLGFELANFQSAPQQLMISALPPTNRDFSAKLMFGMTF